MAEYRLFLVTGVTISTAGGPVFKYRSFFGEQQPFFQISEMRTAYFFSVVKTDMATRYRLVGFSDAQTSYSALLPCHIEYCEQVSHVRRLR